MGRASAFKVYLPAQPTSTAAKDTASKQPQLPPGHNELVLVVDDAERILNLVQQMLKRFGYRVLLATNGVEAVSLYARRQKEIDLVITDMVMPIMDGPATIIALKAINPNVKIISQAVWFPRVAKPKPERLASGISSPNLTRRRPCSTPCVKCFGGILRGRGNVP